MKNRLLPAGLSHRMAASLALGALAVAGGLILTPRLQEALDAIWWLVPLLSALGLGLACELAAACRPTTAASVSLQRLDATVRELPRVRDVRHLLKLITRTLVRGCCAGHAAIYLEDASRDTYWLAATHGTPTPSPIQQLDRDSPLIQWLLASRRPLTRQDARTGSRPDGSLAKRDPSRRLPLILENLQAELIVPSFRRRQLLGILVLGARTDRRIYSQAEIEALGRLARDWAVALENANSYEQLTTTAQKLQSAQGRLMQQERMVAAGRLAMGLAHEIKNPLSAIKTFTEFLPERYNDPAFREEFAGILGKEVDRINRIVQSLADFAKPILLRIETTDAQRVLQETLTLLSNDCLQRNVAIKQAYELDPILLPADPSQLKQAFLNLCTNALDAMPRGGTLSVQCQLQGSEAVIRISDTGVGIAREYLPQLFDPFFSTKQSGMGLGLAVVKQIVEQHAGFILVESELGLGTTCEIRLPLAVRFRAPDASSGKEAAAGRPPGESLFAPLDLFVVDDEPKIRSVLKESFEALGCRVQTASSGEEALERLPREPPHLVVLDLKLQAMDGFEVLRRVKLRYPRLPVIVVTGAYDEGIDRHVKGLGALACFHKPIDLLQLQRTVYEFAAQPSPDV